MREKKSTKQTHDTSQDQDGLEDVDFESVDTEGEELRSRDSVSMLKKKLASCEREKREYLEGWQRSKADFVNLKRKAEEERSSLKTKAVEEVVGELLPVLDSFTMAFSDRSSWEDLPEEWRKGVERIHSQLLSALEHFKVQEFSPDGESFDPAFHEAVGEVETDDPKDDGCVVEVLQRGYMIDGHLLRSAKVKVGSCTTSPREAE